jgi:hypothetical protein
MSIKVCGIVLDKSSEEAMEMLVGLMIIFWQIKTVIPLFKNAIPAGACPRMHLLWVGRQHVRMFYCRCNTFADCSYDIVIRDKGILEKEYEFIQKPTSPNDLLLKMREVLGRLR